MRQVKKIASFNISFKGRLHVSLERITAAYVYVYSVERKGGEMTRRSGVTDLPAINSGPLSFKCQHFYLKKMAFIGTFHLPLTTV